MSKTEIKKPEQTWARIPTEAQKARYEWYESRHEKLIELAQRQTETIGKFLLLINSGGAAAVLAAMAQKWDLHAHLQLTLALYVSGIVMTGLAFAASFYRYLFTIARVSTSFTDHIQNNATDWEGLMHQISERSWPGLPRYVAKSTDLIYWAAFALFICGSIKGWLAFCQ